jgi:RES domain-containing protein
VTVPRDPASIVATSAALPWSGQVWRCHHRSRAALNAEGSLGGVGGRFNAGVESDIKPPFRALYTSAESAAALLEAVRHLGYYAADGRAIVALDDVALRVLTQLRVTLQRVLDWRHAPGLRDGLSKASYRQTQQLGAAAFAAGVEGILVPSATGVDANLVVFVDQLAENSHIEVLRQVTDLQPIIGAFAGGAR